MLDIWFVAGIALGTIVTGFCAIGSFDRGSDSVHRRSWNREHAARKRALLASRPTIRATARYTPPGAIPKAS
ncbi:MAG TPA: hypothetical protein VIN63_12590 [Candidatus Limnocylindria bacterium]|nr:hypothetical protein [Chloroflexota bacterium]